MREGSVWPEMAGCSILRFVYLAYYNHLWYPSYDWRSKYGEDQISYRII